MTVCLALASAAFFCSAYFELAVVDQATDRRIRHRGDLDQVDVEVARHAQGLPGC